MPSLNVGVPSHTQCPLFQCIAYASCIVSPSGRILAGVEEGEGVAVHDLSIDGVAQWRTIATYLEDRKDHIDLYRGLLDL